MTRIHKIVDANTNEVIERPYSKEEMAEYELDAKLKQKEQAQAESKATAKAALLEKLGITAEEATLLLS